MEQGSITQIWCCGGIRSAVEREAGFRDAMADFAIPGREELVTRGEYDRNTGYRAGKRFLAMGDGARTAVFYANNLISLGLMQAVYEVGCCVLRIWLWYVSAIRLRQVSFHRRLPRLRKMR